MKRKYSNKNWLVLSTLLIMVSACAPGNGLFNTSKNTDSLQIGHDAERRGLLGGDAYKLKRSGLKKAVQAEYQALEFKKTGESVGWSDSKTPASGRVIAGHPYRVGTQNCRQYSHEWKINGVPNSARGSACRNEDGTWTPLI